MTRREVTVLKGDLGTTPLAEVLASLAETEATGCLHVDPGDGGDEALIYVKAGHVYSVHVPGRRPQLGARLVSSGALPPEALEEALEAQQTELHGWRLGELLVHLGYVDQSVVSAFVVEQLREATYDLSGWAAGTWKFRKNEKTREDVGGRSSVADLLGEVARRRAEWKRMSGTIQGPEAIPVLSSLGMSAAEIGLDQDQWALLCKVDGERNISQLARDCGFTTFEAGQVVFSLVEAGLLEVETAMGEYDHLADDEDAPDEDAEPMSTADALSSAIAMLGGTRGAAPAAPPAALPEPSSAPTATRDEWSDLLDDTSANDGEGESELGRLFSFGSSSEPAAPTATVDDDPLSKVSEALSALLEGGLEPAEPPAVTSLAARRPAEPPPMDPEELAILDRSRAAAAEELARAHAQAEQEHVADEEQNYGAIEALVASLRDQSPPEPVVPAGPSPEEIAAEVEAKRAAAEEAAAQEAARAAEADRAAAALAAAREAERAAAAAAEAERAAAAEAGRQAAADEADRRAAAEAERAAAREAELAAIEAAEQASLLAAQEAERAAAEEAERLAAEQAEVLAAHEAERLPEVPPPPPPPPAAGAAAADVAAMLRDVGEAEPAPAAAAVDEVADDRDEDEREADDKAHAASQRRQDNDTASLLRELSSLGLDDDSRGGGGGAGGAPQPPTRPTAPRPPAAAPKDQGKKRKGLFGR